jgi:hypothetical protein
VADSITNTIFVCFGVECGFNQYEYLITVVFMISRNVTRFAALFGLCVLVIALPEL